MTTTPKLCKYPVHPPCRHKAIEGSNFCKRHAKMYAQMRQQWEQDEIDEAEWDAPDDWKLHDHTDYSALAAYYDGLITGR